MTKQDLEIAIRLIRKSAEFACGNINYRVENGDVVVWSKSSNGCFFATSTVLMFNGAFNGYLNYNESERRVEFRIY